MRLTGVHEAHSSRRAGVLSSRPPTVLGMVMQCPGWCWGSGDGRTGPMATEVTGPAGPTSRRRPRAGAALSFVFPSRPPPSFFEGAARQPYGSGWHSATGLLLTMPHSVT
jgi:hypothetical protein